jgi:uncharacterized protein YcaQ
VKELTAEEARRIALTAQGFADRKPTLRSLAKRVQALQLDPINVCMRAHYMPAFSRLGPYRRSDLDALAYKKRELFEYQPHVAAILPVDLHPLFRWRMEEWSKTPRWTPPHLDEAIAEITERGALSPSELSFQRRYEKVAGRWGGSTGKSALVVLARAGRVAVAGRRGIEQIYDLPERVLPARVLASPTPPPEEAKAELLVRAAAALGVATATEICGYFGIRNAKPLLDQLVGDGRLIPASVKGWTRPAYLHPAAKARPVDARALVSPFDTVMWFRERVSRLFGFDYKIEIYVPEAQRKYGYYVYPFLLGEEFVARVDLKADRKASRLRVVGSYAEATASPLQVAPALAAELHAMATWLDLDGVEVARKGDLATALRRAA